MGGVYELLDDYQAVLDMINGNVAAVAEHFEIDE